MTDSIAKKLINETSENLRKSILPYWMCKMTAPDGGFYGRRDGYDELDCTAPRGAILNARILWSFAAAYRVLGNPEYLEMANRAKRQIIDRFYDHDNGGVFWSIDADGNPLDTKKQFYAIGFAIYGLSELARANNDTEALDYALRLFEDIEKHSRDTVNGGYIEALDRRWQPIGDMRLSNKDVNSSKTMNTHLHIIEPYTNLLRVVPDNTRLREATTDLLRLFLDVIASDDNRGHLGLFYDDKWNRQDGDISYGHGIEASWLLLETAMTLGDAVLIKETVDKTRHIAEAALQGRCVDGAMIYERHADGRYDNERHWWVQAENVIGQLYLYKYHNINDMLSKTYQSWRYIAENLVDNQNGEWYWSIKDGEINHTDDKAGFWKCPYHNTRMCLEIYETLNYDSFSNGDNVNC